MSFSISIVLLERVIICKRSKSSPGIDVLEPLYSLVSVFPYSGGG